jgi:hypothetical protein
MTTSATATSAVSTVKKAAVVAAGLSTAIQATARFWWVISPVPCRTQDCYSENRDEDHEDDCGHD